MLLGEGGSGVGKTSLLAEAIDIGVKGGFSAVEGVAGARGSEAGLALGVSARNTSNTGIVGHGHRALITTSGLKEVKIWLLGLIKRGPVLVTIDDLHLFDTSILTALSRLIMSLGNCSIVWMVMSNPERDGVDYDLRVAQFTRLGADRIQNLGPLSRDAVTQLMTDCLGAVPDPAVIELAEGVGSAPRTVIELAHGLVQDGDLQVGDGTARLTAASAVPGLAAAGAPGAPRRFVAMVHRRLEPLSASAKKALKVAAVLGPTFSPRDLSTMLDESPVNLLPVLDEAIDRGLVVCRCEAFAFRTAPVWRVVLDSIPLPIRVLVHRQAAKTLLAQPDGLEAAALHLVHSAQHGDIDAVRIISQAAEQLLISAPATAGAFATRGMELVNPDQPDWVLLACTAVEASIREGAVDQAVSLAKDTMKQVEFDQQVSSAHAKAVASLQAWLSVALLFKGEVSEAAAMSGNALAVLEVDAAHRSRAELARLVSLCLTDNGAAVRRADEILGTRDSHARSVNVCAWTVRALGQWRDGCVDEALTLLRNTVEPNRATDSTQLLDPRWVLASMHIKLSELDEALAVIRACSRAIKESQEAKPSFAVPRILRSALHLAKGRLNDAADDARSGIELMADGYILMFAPQAWGVLGVVALRRGNLVQAKEHLDALEELFPKSYCRPWWAMRFLLTAQLAEARSGPREAMAILEDVLVNAEARREFVLEDPIAAPWCVRAAIASEMRDVAELVVATAEKLQADNPKLVALRAGAMHSRALLDRDPDALAQVAALRPNPWEQASTLEDRGLQLLARGDQDAAIDELVRAMKGYTTTGSDRDTARVRRRLRHLGVRRRHWQHVPRPAAGWDSLTETERKVAELVASGLTNREVASQVFISRHTVGFHLRQVFRKLQIHSRIDLIRYKR
ncbi:LuxR family transcriptional regulator [Pseudonocardia eucalypti]|uniref:LuxR family transcriptional regulator n=1 Tax=Pseudonocardia eucalypti TaxID=648755 RepID=A0ABP9QFY0_9PSEU|nr:ATP/maltotriose-dependent transcriptional regulator MalT [Pseudonocardia eucalypti]